MLTLNECSQRCNSLTAHFKLRDYQRLAVEGVFKSWRPFDRVLGVAPTGSGKTVIFADIADQRKDAGCVLIVAHRYELIMQGYL